MNISDVNVYCPDGRFRRGAVSFHSGMIDAVEIDDKAELCDLNLVPGFIDIHVHGSGGFDFLEGWKAISGASKILPSNGVTTFIPTLAAAPAEMIYSAVRIPPHRQIEGSEPHSFHLEGPFISPEQRGAQNPYFMRKPDTAELETCIKLSGNRISYVTVSPELEGAEEFVKYCNEHKIRTGVGHTNATYETTLKSFSWGVTLSNHTFNQMGLFHHRKPAAIGAVLVSESIFCELIADGIHVSEGAIRLLLKTRPAEKIILVTDGIVAQNLGDGKYETDAFDFTVSNGVARLEDGTLAGSTVTMDAALRGMINMSGLPLESVLPMLSANPARALGLNDRGTIEKGKRADFVLLDDALRVKSTYVLGRKVY
jgi:N-acetylglucosamine-6-phosphate deacetylase